MQAFAAADITLQPARIVSALLEWMVLSRRDLPWRQRRDPYAVWIAEIMLQQTRAATVVPYFERWMLRFPDIESLASASLEQVLKLWEGLGYYARARNLHRAAQRIVAQWDGRVPQDKRDLLALPGIGPYTAGAILSLAFGQPEPALDGNARRVLCRIFSLDGEIGEPATQVAVEQVASSLMSATPPGSAGTLNEALMELGALICHPRRPECEACPLRDMCLAKARGAQERLPVRSTRRNPPHFDAVAGVIGDDRNRFLVIRRASKGLLGGLWGFPGGTVKDDTELTKALTEAIAGLIGVHVAVRQPLTSFRHAYTHFSITLHPYRCEMLAGTPRALNCERVAWASHDEMSRLPFAVTDRKIGRTLTQAPAGTAERDAPA
jgi:A/G-specific adenine glycosylase